jgi:signal transduction histidine kinase
VAVSEIALMRSIERTMIFVRSGAVVFALIQVATYYIPYPDGFETYGYAVATLLALGNFAIWLAYRRIQTEAAWRRLSICALSFDLLVTFLFVSVYTFDVDTAIFILIYLMPLEGAIRFQRKGALIAMSAATVFYIGRELIGSQVYGYDFVLASISFRMGIGFMIAIVAGAISERYVREREQVVDLYHHEREAADALRALDEVRGTFLTAVSHELRTPLTSIMGFAMTLENVADELEPKHREMLELVSAQAIRLDHLLGDLLDLQRISMPMSKESHDLSRLIEETVQQLTILANNRRIDVECERVAVECDAPKVERIVENLVLNAVKYTPEDTAIHVALESYAGGALILVDDEGPGVPPALREVIFEPFRRGEQRSQHAPGAGIGLALVARFTAMHGGRAWVEESPGGGASFRVFLP